MTREMIIDIVKAFLKSNDCTDDPQLRWSYKLYQEYQTSNPAMQLTEQNTLNRRINIL